ncbi:MAG: XRE family transcriptional regulator [Clostridia bacterium]|nr:XRE family transcriptional regulator [Clostridia bacterium]
MNQTNMDIRIAILKAGLKHQDIAQRLNMAQPSFSRKMRYKISEQGKEKILQVIEELKNERGESQGQ